MPVAAIAGPILGKVASSVFGGAVSGGSSSNKQAAALFKKETATAENLQATAEKMGGRSDDRWGFYKEHGENVDIMLIDDAVQMFKETFAGGSELAASRAAEDVAAAFDRSAEVRRRAAFRFGGVDPTSGKFQGLERKTETQRATAEAQARSSGRRTEEDRARAILQNASNVAGKAINQSMNFDKIGVGAEKAAADIFSGGAADARADAAGEAALVGDIAGKIPFEDLLSGIGKGGDSPSGASSSGGEAHTVPAPAAERDKPGFLSKRDGGVIPGDGRGGGRINGPGTGRSDSVHAVVDGSNQKVRLSAGEFIIPAHIVKRKGERFFNKMIRG